MLTETVDRFDPDFNVVGDATDCGGQSTDRPDRGLPESARVCRQRRDAGGGDRRHHPAASRARSATRSTNLVTEALRNNLSGCRSISLCSTSRAAAKPDSVPERGAARILRHDRRRATEALHELGRPGAEHEAPGIADQLHRRLWHA
jgi:hypothetical protein